MNKLLQSNGTFDITAPENTGARRALQRALIMEDPDEEQIPELQKRMQNYMTSIGKQYNDTMTGQDLQAILDVANKVKQNPKINSEAAKGIEDGSEFVTDGTESLPLIALEWLVKAGYKLSDLIFKHDN